jgi:hypothetical protein
MSWKFDGKGNAIPRTKEEQREFCEQITMDTIDETGKQIKILIEQKEVWENHTTLGCDKNMVGDDMGHMRKLKHKSDKHAFQIKNNYLNRHQMQLAFNMMYIPSMKYGLPATSSSIQNIEYIQRYAVDKFLSAMGYDHSIPQDLIFGPQELGVFGIRHLFTEMMGMKLDTIIARIRADSNLGKAMVININYIQLICGMEEPILTSTRKLPYINTNWILHIREFLIKIKRNWR